jgi:hypothetical protein
MIVRPGLGGRTWGWSRGSHRAGFRETEMTFVKKNPWIVLIAAFAVLMAIGIATA